MKKTAKKIVAGTVGAAGLFLASAASSVNADSVHHVAKDDTVWALSQKYGVSIESIDKLNGIDTNTNMIYVGQDLQIPTKDSQENTYTVQSGDSLWAIAQKYNTTVDHLKQLNGLSSDTIYIGQTLKLDGKATSQKATTTSTKTATPKASTQKAQSASSVSSTAQSSTKSSVAQPSTAVADTTQASSGSAQTPVVSSASSTQASSVSSSQQPASTSSSSASSSSASQATTNSVSSSQSSSSASSVESSSEASSSTSSVSSVASSASTSTSSSSTSSSSAPVASSTSSSSKQAVIAANHVTYTVQSGDSLYTIADAYGVTVDSLREANPNISGNLTIGQSIIVNNPVKNPQASSSSSVSVASSSSASRVAATNTVSSSSSSQTQTQTSVNQTNTVSSNQAQTQASSSSKQTTAVASSTASSTSTTAAATGTATGSAIVSYAESFIGTPYVYGGTTPSGFDCSGFVQYVYNHFGISLPRTTTQQENAGTQISVSEAQPGDLYFWGSKGSSYHVGICIGNGQYIAAPEPGQSVKIGSIQYFQPSFAVRVL